MAKPVIEVTRAAARHIDRGHPWLWERGVSNVRGQPISGQVAAIVSGPKRRRIGYGFYDPDSPIRARLVGNGEIPSPQWAAEVVGRCLDARRASCRLVGTDAMRLVHGEADSASGLVIDRYGSVATVRFDGSAAEAFWRPYLTSIFSRLSEASINTLYHRGEGVLLGAPIDGELVVHEDDARFEVDLERGQKTGLFLDQRPNRREVAELASGRVLNLCCYTGGFSVHAALGGALEVTSVDIAGPAIDACRRNFQRSGLEAANHRFVAIDVFEFLSDKRVARSFDLVICDPPSFAPKRSAVTKALRAYTSLNRLAISAVKKGGLLVTASCSSHVTREQFAEAVADGARRARREARVISMGGPGADHPSRPGFPEGDYLKVMTIYSPA